MFYSDTLLAKTGPLARVWLASNLERKLTKQNVLSSNLENNVKDIIGDGQAPMALRLSSQLLLGVVKIYSRKAKYLLDDCNEALNKIKIAFRPGNVDLPNNQAHAPNTTTLVMQDAVTELDLFAPLADPEDLLRDDFLSRAPGRDPTLLDFGTSQLLPDEDATPRRRKRLLEMDDLDLGLDFGLEPGVRSTPASEDRSIEMGRRAPTPRRDEPTLLEADDLGLDFGYDADTTLNAGGALPDADDALMLDAGDDADLAAQDAAAFARADERRTRASDSPVSDVPANPAPNAEDSFRLGDQDDTTDTTVIGQAQQRAKRRKVMAEDSETQLGKDLIKKQQNDRSAITRAPTFLPRDPVLLGLMEMQRNGSFVSNLMGSGRMAGWAPELRGILSLEIVRRAGEKKRKRDSGIADVEEGEDEEMPGLEIPADEDATFGAGAGDDFALNPMSDGPLLHEEPLPEDEDQGYMPSPGGNGAADFDVTIAPLLHPAQSGAISLGTKKAVHLLREHFAPGHPASAVEPPTPSKRVKAEALFTDLCPEGRTGRGDATKMFFELLVLGTKDAVAVEQGIGEVGGRMRIRGKRGLWGGWAELGAGGEIASQEVGEGVVVGEV